MGRLRDLANASLTTENAALRGRVSELESLLSSRGGERREENDVARCEGPSGLDQPATALKPECESRQ